MPKAVSERLDSLPQLGRADLHELWTQLFKAASPSRLRKDLLVPILAYRIQEQDFRSLGSDSRRRLRQLAREFEADPNVEVTSVPNIKPGTRLMRQWRGRVHVVNVEGKGYEYKGSRYQSLSEVARLITGTRWSGPLFFGVKRKDAKRTRETE